MRLLLDQNLSRRLVSPLQSYFPETTQVALLGFEKATDEEIWNYAKENEFVIVTKDSDFEELCLLKGAPPKVIWIKIGNTKNEVILNLLTQNRQEIEKLISQDETSCLELFD